MSKLVLALATMATGTAGWFFIVTARASEGPARNLVGFITVCSLLLSGGLWVFYVALTRRLRGDAPSERWRRQGWDEGWDR